ncbi:MAG TPA: AraC family transcriptional regulator [Armatimonadota bacterium]|jgi:AraC-like DNA-binding protein
MTQTDVQAACAAYFATHAVDFVAGMYLRWPAGHYCPLHAHEALEIVYHVSGRGTTTMGTLGACDFLEGSVVAYAPRLPHDQRLATAGEDCCLLIALPDDLPDALIPSGYIPQVTDPMVRAELYHLSRAHVPATPLARLAARARATALVAWLAQSARTALPTATAHPCAIEQAYHFLELEYHRPLRIADVAHAAGISASHLRHQFKERYGMSLVHCLGHIRIARACDLLRHAQLPLATIARLCGFDNERYFSTVFRRYLHCTPGAFRRRGMTG